MPLVLVLLASHIRGRVNPSSQYFLIPYIIADIRKAKLPQGNKVSGMTFSRCFIPPILQTYGQKEIKNDKGVHQFMKKEALLKDRKP
ncbi:uncharacterized protein BDR25DRAFT_361166 [Lindgomyces ingoldianus]|uniref:Uncharacterized protein n=1 Tax=Lindgomyces ingoldianus TaxID=673940 RepID=A0ACB6QDF7_9PLEO|nr:uncharacterized protein BDR25DRAFT_361166 [Lindgomyces ingoldianus]KAF2464949.1 hypothetical protein BDR25DRAFT_361166 [Lindgomyces ingoldianus]